MSDLDKSSDSDTSEEEDEDAKELTEDLEKKFFKTLSFIKKKDPKIYDENVIFFTKDESGESQVENNTKKKKKKDLPLNLRAYERKLIIERGGELSDEELGPDEDARSQSPTYNEEQKALKESFKKVLSDEDSDNDKDSWGGLFRKREKTSHQVKEEDKEYREWLKGQKEELADKEAQDDMKHLHDYWTDPKLDQGEQFLRDYILNRRFLDKDEEPEVDMNKLLEEERELEEQTEFEHKYNYRFEEPDQEFIKRYPRVMANSLRVKDERRKEKREEIKERKSKEKEKKREKIRLKKKIKKQEIEEKLEQLKKLTGNDQLAFESHLNADFDQDEYDRAMRRLFNEEFYAQEDPNFNPQEAMAEEYDGLWKDEDFTNGEDYTNNDEDINCEDPNFVMDCDYDPTKVPKKKKKDVKGRRARDKHRRTTVSEAVSREKPLFDPAEHCSFQDYIDQYYGIDCEDFIGEQPCRFKYKRVTPNSYGLTVEEILAADDKELERWCSMKRVHKAGSVAKERNDAKMYSKRAMNNELKQKILPSLFSVNAEKDLNENLGSVKTKKNKNKGENEFLNEKVQNEETQINGLQKDRVNSRISNDNITENNHIEEVTNKKRKKRKSDKNNSSDETAGIEEENTNEYISSIDISDNKKQRKRKHDNQEINIQHESPKKLKLKNMKNTEETTSKNVTKKEKKKKNIEQSIGDLNTNGLDLNKSVGKSRRQKRNEKARLLKKKLNTSRKYSKTFKVADRFEKKIPKGNTFKVKKNDIKGGNKIGISDSRLQAYGIKPKVFKDKLKYGSQFKMFLETDK